MNKWRISEEERVQESLICIGGPLDGQFMANPHTFFEIVKQRQYRSVDYREMCDVTVEEKYETAIYVKEEFKLPEATVKFWKLRELSQFDVLVHLLRAHTKPYEKLKIARKALEFYRDTAIQDCHVAAEALFLTREEKLDQPTPSKEQL